MLAEVHTLVARIPPHTPIWNHDIPLVMDEIFQLLLILARLVAPFEAEVLDFAFVGFAQAVDLLAGDGVFARDGRLEAGEVVELEEVA